MPEFVVDSARVTDEPGDSEDCFRWARWSPNRQYHDESEYRRNHCRRFAPCFFGAGRPTATRSRCRAHRQRWETRVLDGPGSSYPGARVGPPPAFGRHHHGHAEDDHGSAEQDLPGHVLVQDQPPQQDGDRRVHVRIGADQRDRRVRQQIAVRRVREQRPEHDQVRECDPPRRVDPVEVQSPGLSPQYADQQHRRTAEEHLVERGDQRIARQTQPRREARTGRPADRAHHQDRHRQGLRGRVAAGQREQCDAGESDQYADPRERARTIAAADAQQHHPQRDRGDQQRGQSGRNCLLRDRDRTVAEGKQQQTDDGRAERLLPGDPQSPPARLQRQERGQQDAGRQEPGRHPEHRRDLRLDDHPDAEVRRTPDDVHDRERGPDHRRGRLTATGLGQYGGGSGGHPRPHCQGCNARTVITLSPRRGPAQGDFRPAIRAIQPPRRRPRPERGIHRADRWRQPAPCSLQPLLTVRRVGCGSPVSWLVRWSSPGRPAGVRE